MDDILILATKRRRSRVIAALGVAMTAVFIAASPAFATPTATGTGEETAFVTGRDFGNQNDPHCLEVTDSSYSVDFTSHNFDAGAGISWNGTFTVTWSTSPTYWIAEAGAYTNATLQDGCDLGTLGDGISSSVTLVGGNTTDGVSCTGSGSYERGAAMLASTDPDFGKDIGLTFSLSCTVYDENTTGSAPLSLSGSFDGLLNPCFATTPPTCTSSTITDGEIFF